MWDRIRRSYRLCQKYDLHKAEGRIGCMLSSVRHSTEILIGNKMIEIDFKPKMVRPSFPRDVMVCPTCGCTKQIINVFGAPFVCGFHDYNNKKGLVFKKECKGWK